MRHNLCFSKCCMKLIHRNSILLLVVLFLQNEIWASTPMARITEEGSRGSLSGILRFLTVEENRIESVAKALIGTLDETSSAAVPRSRIAKETLRLAKEFENSGEDSRSRAIGQSCFDATEEHRSYVLKRVHGFAYRQARGDADFGKRDVRAKLARLQLLSDQRSEVRGWLRDFQLRCPESGKLSQR